MTSSVEFANQNVDNASLGCPARDFVCLGTDFDLIKRGSRTAAAGRSGFVVGLRSSFQSGSNQFGCNWRLSWLSLDYFLDGARGPPRAVLDHRRLSSVALHARVRYLRCGSSCRPETGNRPWLLCANWSPRFWGEGRRSASEMPCCSLDGCSLANAASADAFFFCRPAVQLTAKASIEARFPEHPGLTLSESHAHGSDFAEFRPSWFSAEFPPPQIDLPKMSLLRTVCCWHVWPPP